MRRDFDIVVVGHVTFGIWGFESGKLEDSEVTVVKVDAGKCAAFSGSEDTVFVSCEDCVG